MTVDTSKRRRMHIYCMWTYYSEMMMTMSIQAMVAIGDMMLLNKQRNLQKTSVMNVNIALSHYLRWFAINDIVVPIQFESIGVQNHFRRQRLLRIIQAFLQTVKLSIKGSKIPSLILTYSLSLCSP